MAAKEKISILFLLLLLFIFSSAGNSYGVLADVIKLTKFQKESNVVLKDVMMTTLLRKNGRKLMGENAMVDYYEGGANPVHEPPGKGRSKYP